MSRSSVAYAAVTAAYWAFTLTDGALRMLVLLHFHAAGVAPTGLALLFVLYEACGVVTNLVGGRLAARLGLRTTLRLGLSLQIVALGLLAALPDDWPRAAALAWVVATQALSGVAKDLTKLGAKSAMKALAPAGATTQLFRLVAVLTGSKNALKGAGFFLGAALLGALGFTWALATLAAGLALVWLASLITVPPELGPPRPDQEPLGLRSPRPEINQLALARFWLFAARDLWFVVGVPVFLVAELGFADAWVGGFLAAWVIGYGGAQALTPWLLARVVHGPPTGRTARALAAALTGLCVVLAAALALLPPLLPLFVGLALFALVFAVNSAVHSYLIVAYARAEHVTRDVGFYYTANAAGRLVGTLLSGVAYAAFGVVGCLAAAAAFAALATLSARRLP